MGRHEARPPGVLHVPRRVLVAGGVAVAAALVVAAALALRNGDPSTDATPGARTSSTVSPSPSTTAASVTSSAASPSMMAMGPTLELRAVGVSWVEVRGPNDQVLVARTFQPGDSATFSQRRVHVTVGNAAAMRIKANGMPVKPGRPGQVQLLSVVRGGD